VPIHRETGVRREATVRESEVEDLCDLGADEEAEGEEGEGGDEEREGRVAVLGVGAASGRGVLLVAFEDGGPDEEAREEVEGQEGEEGQFEVGEGPAEGELQAVVFEDLHRALGGV
jgi:hypothetical protein